MPADGGATNPWGSYIKDEKEKALLKDFEFQDGPLGLGFIKSGDGFAITNVNEGGQADLLGVEVGTHIMRANKKLLYFMDIEEVQTFLMSLKRPLVLQIKARTQAEIMHERRTRVAAAPSTTAEYRHPLLTGNVEVSQQDAAEDADRSDLRDMKHTPASMMAEKQLPKGVPAGRPFFWDCVKVSEFVKAIGFSEEVSLNCLGKGVDGLYLMTISVEEAYGLGMNGTEDLRKIRKWVTLVLRARTESKQECLQLLIGNYHKKLGIQVAKHPLLCIFLSLAVLIALASGIGMLKGKNTVGGFINVDNDFMENFAVPTHDAYKHYNEYESSFPHSARINSVLFTPKSGASILTVPAILDMFALRAEVDKVKVVHKSNAYDWSSLCFNKYSGCEPDSILQFWDNDLSKFNKISETESPDKYLAQFSKKELEGLLGEISCQGGDWTDGKCSGAINAKGAAMTLSLIESKDGTETSDSGTQKWELALKKMVINEDPAPPSSYSAVDLACKTERGDADESVAVWDDMVPIIISIIILMTVYCMWTMGKHVRDAHDVPIMVSQYVAISSVVLSPVLSTLAGFGILGFAGMTINTFCLFVPFLVLGIGIDDCYVILNYMQLAPPGSPDRPMPELVGEVMRRAGAAIFTTTTTDCIGFIVGATLFIGTSRGFVNFCIVMVFSLALDYVFQMTLFLPFIVLNYKYDFDKKLGLGKCVKESTSKSKSTVAPEPRFLAPAAPETTVIEDVESEAEEEVLNEAPQVADVVPQVGPPPENPSPARKRSVVVSSEEAQSYLRSFCKDKLAPFVVKYTYMILACSAVLFIISLVGALNMGTGMEEGQFYSRSSYMTDYISTTGSLFDGKRVEALHVVVEREANIHNNQLFSPKSQKSVENLLEIFHNRSDIVGVENWISRLAQDNGGVTPDGDAAALSFISTGSNEAKYGDFISVDSSAKYGEQPQPAEVFPVEEGTRGGLFAGNSDAGQRKLVTGDTKSVTKLTSTIFFLQPYSVPARLKQYASFQDTVDAFFEYEYQTGRIYGADKGRFKVVISSKSFAVHISQYDTVKIGLLQATFVSVYGVFLAMIIILPVPAALFCTANLMACSANVIGFLFYIGETYNFLTTAVCILSVGLCVDYSVHIIHVFMHCPGTKVERITTAITEIGPSIINGGMTSILGVLLCLAGGAESIVLFGVMAIMVVIFGLFQGMVVLPATLMVVGDGIDQKGFMVAVPSIGFFVLIIFMAKCAWCIDVADS